MRKEFEPFIGNFNDYLRFSCQLGLIDNIRVGKTAEYTPTEYAQRIHDNEGAIGKIIRECILDIMEKSKEEVPQERHAIFLLWYFLKLKGKGGNPDEADFNKGKEVNYYPVIRLDFSESLCNFLFGGDRLKEQEYLQKWDQFIRI